MQDNGSAYQSAPGNSVFNTVDSGDGVNVAVNNVTLGGDSAIYVSAQYLGAGEATRPPAIERRIVDQNGDILKEAIISFKQDVQGLSFSSPFVLNNIDKYKSHIAIAGTAVYVTEDPLELNRNAEKVELRLTDLGNTDSTITTIDYGTRNNPNALLAGGRPPSQQPNTPRTGTLFLSKVFILGTGHLFIENAA